MQIQFRNPHPDGRVYQCAATGEQMLYAYCTCQCVPEAGRSQRTMKDQWSELFSQYDTFDKIHKRDEVIVK